MEGKFFIFPFSLISTFCLRYSTGSYQLKTHAHVKFNHGFFFSYLTGIDWFSVWSWGGTKSIFFHIAIWTRNFEIGSWNERGPERGENERVKVDRIDKQIGFSYLFVCFELSSAARTVKQLCTTVRVWEILFKHKSRDHF